MDWTQITGWLSRAEGDTLALLAQGKTVLEIGSYQGRSTVCMAKVARVVHSLDWHQGDRFCRAAGAPQMDTLNEMRANLHAHGVTDKVVLHVGPAATIAPMLVSGAFDLVFVDGAHDAESVMADVALARRVVKANGIIACHDWNMPSVQAGAALLRRPDQVVDSLAVWKV